MEIHRLQEMKPGYNEELFNKLYEEVTPLKKSLARQIDPRRYGVSSDIIESWFDDKFIFVFNKHCKDKEPNILKAFIINSMQTFKYRVLRKAYNKEGEFYQSLVDLEGESELINIIPDKSFQTTENLFYNLALEFMKEKLSENAFLVFQLQMDPPPYIINRIKKSTSRIPNEVIIDFLDLDLGDESKTERYVKKLKKEINNTIKMAKSYFEQNELPLAIRA